MPRSSPTWLRSTTTFGRLMRSFSQSKLSSPPAITQASGAVPLQQRQRVVNRRRLEELERRHHVANDSHNSVLLAQSYRLIPMLDVRRQRLVHRLARFERRQNHVRRHRRAPEDLVADARRQIAFRTAAQPPPTGGSPMPRAPTGVSGSGMSTAAHCMFAGASRIVGGLL